MSKLFGFVIIFPLYIAQYQVQLVQPTNPCFLPGLNNFIKLVVGSPELTFSANQNFLHTVDTAIKTLYFKPISSQQALAEFYLLFLDSSIYIFVA